MGACLSPCAREQRLAGGGGGLGPKGRTPGDPSQPSGPEVSHTVSASFSPDLGPPGVGAAWAWGPKATQDLALLELRGGHPQAATGGVGGDGEAWPPSPSVASLPNPDVHFNLTIPEDPGETGGWPVLAVRRRARTLALPVPPAPQLQSESGPQPEAGTRRGARGPVTAAAPAQRRPDRCSGQHNVPRPLSLNRV